MKLIATLAQNTLHRHEQALPSQSTASDPALMRAVPSCYVSAFTPEDATGVNARPEHFSVTIFRLRVSWQVREYMNRVVRAESEASRAKVEAVRVSEALQRADQDIQASAEEAAVPISSLSAMSAG